MMLVQQVSRCDTQLLLPRAMCCTLFAVLQYTWDDMGVSLALLSMQGSAFADRQAQSGFVGVCTLL